MPILNYTTSIDSHRTISEVQRLLAKHGARGVLVEYDGQGDPVALAFILQSGIYKKTVPSRAFALDALFYDSALWLSLTLPSNVRSWLLLQIGSLYYGK
jgi:hypothetical protein